MTIKENVENMNAMILTGKGMGAFEKYYDENVVMQENENPPTHGKEANRKREKEFSESIESFHGAEIKAVAVGKGVTMVEWVFDTTIKGMQRSKRSQVAVQKWKKGKIISEKFYYDSLSKN